MYQVDYGTGVGLAAAFLGIFAIIWLVCIAIAVVQIIGMWKTFKKAGLKGWAAIIPFYNMYTVCKMTWGSGWYFFLCLIPLGGVIFQIVTYVKVAKVFGKSGGFAVGLIFLAPIFWMILGCGNATYLGPDTEGKGKKPAIIASAVLGVIWLIIFIITMVIASVATSTGISQYQDGYKDYSYEGYDNYSDIEDYSDGHHSSGDSLDISQYGDDVKATTLSNGYTTIQIPIWDGEYTYAEGGSTASSNKSGIQVDLSLGYDSLNDVDYGTSLEEEVSNKIDTYMGIYSEMEDFISDVYKDEMLYGEDWVLQQLNYTYNISGASYGCFDIVKADDVNGYPLVITISVNNAFTDEHAKEALEEACEMYGVDFEFD